LSVVLSQKTAIPDYKVSLRDGLCWFEHSVMFFSSSSHLTELYFVLGNCHLFPCRLKCEQPQESRTWRQRQLLVHLQVVSFVFWMSTDWIPLGFCFSVSSFPTFPHSPKRIARVYLKTRYCGLFFFLCFAFHMGLKSVRYSDSLQDGRPGDRIPIGSRPYPSWPNLGSSWLPVKLVPVHFIWVQAVGSWRWPLIPYSAEIKERVGLYLFSPPGLSWHGIGWKLPFLSPSPFMVTLTVLPLYIPRSVDTT